MSSMPWLSKLLGPILLVGCGGTEHYDAAEDASPNRPPEPRASDSASEPTSPRDRTLARGEAKLSVSARSALQRRLGAVHYVVRDAADEVVAGGDQEAAGGNVDELALDLALPAGNDLRLELTATTLGAEASSCRASVGPFSIEEGSQASFEVFVWRCDGAPGAATPEPECYWLADWIGVTRTSAAIGELIGVSAAGHGAAGEPARFSWSTTAPEPGRFKDPHAGETSFRCAAPTEALPLSVAISDGQCQSHFTQLVSCR